MLRIVSFVEPTTSRELILPVTPAAYSWTGPAKLETVSLDQIGEATLYGGRKMGSGSLEDVLLPAQAYPFIVPGGRVDPEGYIAELESWRDKGARLQWIVSGTGINLSVMLESITKEERDGTNDRYLSISMRQYQALETPVLAINGGTAATARDSQTGAAVTKSCTVQPGDCLWTLAEKYYGDGAQYPGPAGYRRGDHHSGRYLQHHRLDHQYGKGKRNYLWEWLFDHSKQDDNRENKSGRHV